MNTSPSAARPGLLFLAVVAFAASQTFAAPIEAQDALVVRDGVLETKAGKRVGLYGVNIFQSHMHWARRQDPEAYRTELAHIAASGFNAVRMPLNMSFFMPAQGVLPDDPRYAETLEAHRLPTGAMAFYDGLVAEAARLGLYVIPEFHELPTDPYRWFAGGVEQDRGTGKPGTAVAWMAKADAQSKHHPDLDLAQTEVPKTLAFLARHWRGVPNIVGIEVPWNEPIGDITQPGPFAAIVKACADAVKAADPDRLVLLCTVDWGAMVNYMPDESVWKIPDNVDILFPHFYPGMHSGNSGETGTWSTSMASWASWLAGAGRPVMVGEYGTVEMHRAGYWKGERSEAQKAATYAASVAQWQAQGVQGVFAWAWQGGVDRDEATGRLKDGAHVLPLWSEAFPAMKNEPLPKARLAIVCAPSMRAAYGSRQDLWRIADARLDAQLTPFATVFDSQMKAQSGVLARYEDVWVITNALAEGVLEQVRASGRRVREFDRKLDGLDDAVAALRPPRPSRLPANVLAAVGDTSVALFERKGKGGTVRLHALPAMAKGQGRLVADDGREIAAGSADAMRSEGYAIPLAPWSATRLNWAPDAAASRQPD